MKLAPGRRWPAWVAVVGLHLGLALLLWQHRPPASHASGEKRLVTLRLLPPERTPPPPRPAPLPPPLRAPAPIPITPVPSPKEETPPATTAPAPPAVVAAPPPAEPPRTTLHLSLPPGYAASASPLNAALNDPRSNTARRTLEQQIANAAAVTGDWVVEHTSDGRTRRRRGDTCVETEESRIASIDRFNENVAPRAAMMTGKPYKCR